MTRLFKVVLLLIALTALGACTPIAYYAQSAQGHLALMYAARPIDEVLADPATPADLKPRLELARRIRAFAVTDLALPDNASYHRYSDLKRRAAVWNVAAAPPDSLTLKRWCFPVVGCVGYRGYYDEAAAKALAAQLEKDEGLEVRVYGIPAYSTLGWMNWAGGDPLLSTFIRYPEGELARMIFHELSHQVVYVDDDTMFNESYATAVERLGVAQWLRTQASAAARRAATKSEAMARFRQRYAELKARWAAAGAPFDGYDPWVAEANNAFFGIQAAYDELVPGFEALFEREDRDWPRFHAAVRDLARAPMAERQAQLKALAGTAATLQKQ